MPNGSSDIEKRLGKRWDFQLANELFATLTNIAISSDEGAPGLRGVGAANVAFNYPVTVLVGKNGTGKTTLLGLAAMAFHSPVGYCPPGLQGRGEEETGSYTAKDFFHRASGDADPIGLQVDWSFSPQDDRSLKKRTRKWMQYDRRPKRPVDFIGVSRVVPAVEQRVLRGYFTPTATSVATPLPDDARAAVSSVMARAYGGAEILETRGHEVRRCSAGEYTYSSFNMGAGEDVLFELMARLYECPE